MKTRLLHYALREPLLHFLVLGIGLFLLHAQFGVVETRPASDYILVDEAELSRLSQQFQRTWMRPPTHAELAGLAEDFVKEEILYREALALGLDQDDLVIRRRMRQKMEFLNADLTEQEPTEADLEAYLQANPEMFRQPARFSLQQIFLKAEGGGEDLQKRARTLLTRLQSESGLDADPEALGDSTLLPSRMERVTERELVNIFGNDFAAAVQNLQPGGWTGPHPSAYGLHLVQVSVREPGNLPTLAQVRPAVEREWANERRLEANTLFYQALRDRYTVEIRLPEGKTDASLAAPGQDRGQLAARP